MKTLGNIGVVLAVLAALCGVYLQFVVVPSAEVAEASIELSRQIGGDRYFEMTEYRMNLEIIDAVITVGTITMFFGFLTFLISIVPALKKQRIAWIGVIVGLAVGFLGAAHGTHMFS